MKKILAATVMAVGFWAGTAHAVTTITYNAGSGTPVMGTEVFQNFDSLAPGSSIGPNAVVLNTTSDQGARPAFGSTGNFATVFNSGSYTVNFNPTTLFSFVLGSLDTFNSLTLRYTDGSTQVLNGGAIVNDPSFDSGNRTSAETNGVVSYRVTSGPLLSSAIFASTGGNSFEFDNLSAAVPEPAAWGMMILGFGLVGGALRRRPTTKVKFAY